MSSGSPLPLRISSRSSSKERVSAGRPPRITPAFAVVPPMSIESASSRPARRPWWAAISAPAAGPDSIVRTGSTTTSRAGVSPPLDCIIHSGARSPTCGRVSASRPT